MDSEGGERVPVTLEAGTAPVANRWANQRNQAVDTSGFRAYLDTRRLPGGDIAVPDRLWQLQVRVRSHGLQPTVLDVTSYPEINDLILAADVAILGYSSLRFDWLITEKPVVFFVPDLEDYLSARTVLFDYRSSAPGSLLRSTADVVTALRDLPAVSTDYASARRAFNATFNGLHDGKAAKRVVDAFFADEAPDG